MNAALGMYPVEQDQVTGDDGAIDAPPMVSVDERRMQVRAYNAWSALLGMRQWPSIEDLDLGTLEFSGHSILLDFTAGVDDPAIIFLGDKLRAEGGVNADVRQISAVPRGSLVSRLTDHYLQILANCAPIGFEAEYVNAAGADILYRGILLPFSTDDESIDFVLGVINWKEGASVEQSGPLLQSVEQALRSPAAARTLAPWADGPQSEKEEQTGRAGPQDGSYTAGGLYDRLADARVFADQARDADGRGRSALYRAIGMAWDFALQADQHPDLLHEIYADAGLKAQARSPMTPLVKLIFGATTDKTRIAEYATALGYAREQAIPAGALAAHIEQYDGGLKALVKDVRAQRRAVRPDAAAPSKDMDDLRQAASVGVIDHDAGDAEFVILIGRANADGQVELVARAADDEKLIARLAKKAVPLT